jgi:hypothetical protein
MDNVSNLTDDSRREIRQSTSGQSGEFVQLPITLGNDTLYRIGFGDVQL